MEAADREAIFGYDSVHFDETFAVGCSRRASDCVYLHQRQVWKLASVLLGLFSALEITVFVAGGSDVSLFVWSSCRDLKRENQILFRVNILIRVRRLTISFEND